MGGTDRDDILRAQLSGYANDTIAEIDREQRWTLSYAEPTFTTTQGTQSYAIPLPTTSSSITSPLFMARLYYEDTAGRITILDRYAKEELQRAYGDPVGTQNQGAPTRYAIEPNANLATTAAFGSPALQIILYPTPDGSGPETAPAGAYKIHVGGFYQIPPIIEVTGTSVATNATLTVPSTVYLTNLGVPADGTSYGLTLSVKGAGALSLNGVNSSHVTSWSAFPTGATITMSVAAVANQTNAQVFFNSTNWVITHWPKLLLFGMLREVANYYGKTDDYTLWEARFHDQMDKLRQYEFARARGTNSLATAQVGQRASIFRRSEGYSTIDVRGGGTS